MIRRLAWELLWIGMSILAAEIIYFAILLIIAPDAEGVGYGFASPSARYYTVVGGIIIYSVALVLRLTFRKRT